MLLLSAVWVILVMPIKDGATAANEVWVQNVYFENQKDCDDFWKAKSTELIDVAHAHRHGLSFGDHRPVPHAATGAQATYTCVEKEKP